MAKEPQQLKWIESLLPEDEYRRKGMFGGFAYYVHDKIVLLMFENPGERSYRSQQYDFEIWNGCMFPVEKEFQGKALEKFPFLISHPILPKWLYLPLETEGFDDMVADVLAQAIKPTSFWGSIPKSKTQKKAKSVSAKNLAKISEKIDTRTPRMFGDEPAEQTLAAAQRISDLKNMGPVTEEVFKKAGIKTAPQFIKMGWKKAMIQLVKSNPKNRHTIFAYVLIGALTNKEWNRLSDEEKIEARDFVHSLAPIKKKALAKKVQAKNKTSKKTTSKKKTAKKTSRKK